MSIIRASFVQSTEIKNSNNESSKENSEDKGKQMDRPTKRIQEKKKKKDVEVRLCLFF